MPTFRNHTNTDRLGGGESVLAQPSLLCHRSYPRAYTNILLKYPSGCPISAASIVCSLESRVAVTWSGSGSGFMKSESISVYDDRRDRFTGVL